MKLLSIVVITGCLLAIATTAIAKPVHLRAGFGASAGPKLQTSISSTAVATKPGFSLTIDGAFPLNEWIQAGLRLELWSFETKSIGKELLGESIALQVEGTIPFLNGEWHPGASIGYQCLADTSGLFTNWLFSESTGRHGLIFSGFLGASYRFTRRLGVRPEIGMRMQPYGRYDDNDLTYNPTPYFMVMLDILVGKLQSSGDKP